MEDLKELVLAGPDPALHGVTRWRCIDLCGVLAERYEVVVAERTAGKKIEIWFQDEARVGQKGTLSGTLFVHG